MDFIIAVFAAISLSAISVLLLTLMASAESVRELFGRMFLIFHTPLEMLRDGCKTVLSKAWGYVKTAGSSLGISGEHWVQRLIGSILIAVASTLGVIVGTLGLMVGLEGAFSSPETSILEYIPVPVEILMAIEMAVAGFLFGLLLLDVLNVTHLTKFYSPEHLPKWLKHTFTGVFLAGTLYSIYLFGLSGVVRASSLISGNSQAMASSINLNNGNDQSMVYIPNEKNSEAVNAQGNITVDSSLSEPISEGYIKSTTHLMVGIPVVAIFSGILSGVGLIASGGLILVTPIFLISSIFFGSFWLFGSAGMRIVELIYNFVLSFFNMFINLGDSIKRRIWGNRVEQTQTQGQDNAASQTQQPHQTIEEPVEQRAASNETILQEQDGNNAQEASPEETDNQHTDPIYSQHDPNWNPLGHKEEGNNV